MGKWTCAGWEAQVLGTGLRGEGRKEGKVARRESRYHGSRDHGNGKKIRRTRLV